MCILYFSFASLGRKVLLRKASICTRYYVQMPKLKHMACYYYANFAPPHLESGHLLNSVSILFDAYCEKKKPEDTALFADFMTYVYEPQICCLLLSA